MKATETEVCFFAMSDSFIRMKCNAGEGIYGIVRQITYRCGVCGGPVVEGELQAHFDRHANVPSKAKGK